VLLRRRLPRTSFVLLTISVVCAVASGLVMRAYARRLDAVRPDGGPPISFVATVEKVSRGDVLTPEALELVPMPTRFAPPGAIRALVGTVGKVAVADIAPGEIVTAIRLAGASAGRTASLVPPGMRAVGVPVSGVVDVEPGDLVDVIATFGGGGAHTEVTAEAVEVLQVDRDAGGSLGAAGAGTSGGPGLVLLVTRTDAEQLAFASTFATLSIAVRGPDDFVPGESFTVPVTTDG
jgi:Flp pilus assembly protein CpaB